MQSQKAKCTIKKEIQPFGMKNPLYTSSLFDEWGAPESHCPVISIFKTDENYE